VLDLPSGAPQALPVAAYPLRGAS